MIKTVFYCIIIINITKNNFYMKQINMITTFLYNFIKKKIYVVQLIGFENKILKIYHLFKILYNLK